MFIYVYVKMEKHFYFSVFVRQQSLLNFRICVWVSASDTGQTYQMKLEQQKKIYISSQQDYMSPLKLKAWPHVRMICSFKQGLMVLQRTKDINSLKWSNESLTINQEKHKTKCAIKRMEMFLKNTKFKSKVNTIKKLSQVNMKKIKI